MADVIDLPELSLVVLLGTAGSGKSTFARRCFAATEVLSSDRFRAMITDDEARQDVNADAFEALHLVADRRLKHRRLTVIDATNLETRARQPLRRLAKQRQVPTVVLALDVPQDECVARDRARADRSVGAAVIREQRQRFERSLGKLAEEGFRDVRVLSAAQVERATVARTPLENDRRDLEGPFDVIGDVHGCAEELRALLSRLGWREEAGAHRHPGGRTAVFLGDLVDRGPDTPGVLRLVMAMVEAGTALCLPGNHEAKLARWLRGKRVKESHGLEVSVAQLAREPEGFGARVLAFIESRPSHYRLDGGALVVAHAGLKEAFHGRTGGKVRSFCLYGDTTGEKDEHGLPIRLDWARDYEGEAVVVYGHTPVAEAVWVNETICIDTGCVFGGKLTALRWPERRLVQIPARRVHFEPPRPLA
ncbi:MAG TPA: AAA family ATPase [Sandaracinaceae bacterium LLY-WYZ-13_1]|nr:AAA family ATPase [Sandaracinaceae bacterium LLY-WYZ-13_1]